MFHYPKLKSVNPFAKSDEVVSAYEIISRKKEVLKIFDTYAEAKNYCNSHRGSYSIRYKTKVEQGERS